MNIRLMLNATVFSLLVATSSHASIQTTPTGLNPGDQYRLVFVTSTVRKPNSSNIADYNIHVSNAATAVTELNDLGTTWTAIGSTQTVDARVNTSTTGVGTGIKIFNLLDTKVADDYSDFWDGTLDAAIKYSELGTTNDLIKGMLLAATGTDSDGTANVTQYLGTALSNSVRFGNGLETNSNWVNQNTAAHSVEWAYYGISGVLTVPGAVPEPTAFIVWSLLGLTASGIVYRRKRAA